MTLRSGGWHNAFFAAAQRVTLIPRPARHGWVVKGLELVRQIHQQPFTN